MSKRIIDTKNTQRRNIHKGVTGLLVILQIFGKQSIRNVVTGKIYRKYSIENLSTTPNVSASIQ
jgi:hypothetical protein